MGLATHNTPILLFKAGGGNMDVILISKVAFVSGEFKGVKSIAFDESTQLYTITKSDNTTATYSAVSYYLQIVWG